MLGITNQGDCNRFKQTEKSIRQNLFIAVWVCLAGVVLTPAQTSTGSLVVIRNVRVADGESNRPVNATVLVSGGKITRVDADALLPVGAVEIDGGGNILTLGANGRIILRADANTAAFQNQPKPKDVNPQDQSNADFIPAVSAGSSLPDRKDSDSRKPAKNVFVTNRRDLKTLSEEQNRQQNQPDNLAQKVVDPSAGLSTVTFQNKYIPSLWGIDGDENEFNVQAAIPYHLGGKLNVFRATVPFLTDTPAPGNNGLGDVALLNLTILPQGWGNFLIGPVATFGTNKGAGVDTFAIGPSIGAVLKKGRWTYGFLNQNLFSFGGDIKTTQLQPILAYTFSETVSFALGDVQYTIDWNKKKFVTAPVSGQINYIHMFGKQPVRFFFNAQYNFLNEFGQRKWTLSPGLALILR